MYQSLCLASLRMPRNLAMCPICHVLVVGEEHQRREGHIKHRQPFLDRIS